MRSNHVMYEEKKFTSRVILHEQMAFKACHAIFLPIIFLLSKSISDIFVSVIYMPISNFILLYISFLLVSTHSHIGLMSTFEIWIHM